MRINKFFSVFLSLLMLCSIFGGLSVSATTIDKTHTYTVVGDAPFLGANWDQTAVANDMELQADGTYKKTYTNVSKSDCYSIKVTEDHDWSVNFGSNLGENNPQNIEFSVPMDNSTVDVILTLKGTRNKDGKVITDGFVKVLVDGVDAPGKVVPTETTHYVAGEAGLCNGINWEKDNEINKMTKNQDGSYEITFKNIYPKKDGTAYEFKVVTDGGWKPAYNYDGVAVGEDSNAKLVVTEYYSTVKIVLTADLKVKVYVNGEDVTPKSTPTTTRQTQTTNNKCETSAVTSLGGIYTGPFDSKSVRLYFAMPAEWKTFNNATACAYWGDGTDSCTDWQHSYQMRSTPIVAEDGAKVYYIDIATDICTIIFNNGIYSGEAPKDGEEAPPNWGKNYQTTNVSTQGYSAGESVTYPDGIKDFNNMVYVIDPELKDVNHTSGATVFGGEWYYLHADGNWDLTPGTTYEIKDVNVILDKRKAKVDIGNTFQLKPTFANKAYDAYVEWTSSNPEIATVDENGLVTGKSVGTTNISVSVTNPGDGEPVIDTCKVTVEYVYNRLLVSDLPNKITYIEGEEFDPTGLEIMAITDSGSGDVISDDLYTLDVPDKLNIGKNTITVKFRDLTTTFDITVTPKDIRGIKVYEPNKTEYTEGEELDLEGMEVLAYYEDGSIGLVDDYEISGYESTMGEKIIEVTCRGKKAYFTVTVNEKPIKSILVSSTPNKTNYYVGDKIDTTGLEVYVYYEDNTSKKITNYILDYDFSKSGKQFVTVYYKGYMDQFVVNVEPKAKPTVKKVTKVEVNKKSVTLLNGRSATVKVKVSPTNATNKKLKWTSSNSKIATVNQSGKITAKGRGNATIKVMALDGTKKYATVKVTVKQPVTSVKLNRNSAILKVKGKAKQKTVTLKATVYPKNANVKSVKWTTSKSKIATVAQNGKVTAKKKGTCFIYATAKDGSKKYAKCKITVK